MRLLSLAFLMIAVTNLTCTPARAQGKLSSASFSGVVNHVSDANIKLTDPSLVSYNGGPAFSAAPASSPTALRAFSGAWSAVTAYNATITVFEQNGAVVQTVIFKYTFRKPSTVTIDVIGGPNNGVSLLWTGGSTLSAHRSGLAAAFKQTLSLYDPKITTIRGSSIDELSFAQILAHAQQTPGKISQESGLKINGVATDAVTLIPNHPLADAGYTREVIEISRMTHFPLRIMGYQGSTLVRRVDFVAVDLTH